MTGYLHLLMEKGSGARIKILQSESYVLGGEIGDLKVPLKGDREDMEHGYLDGFTDQYKCAGYGTVDEPEIYEHSGSGRSGLSAWKLLPRKSR